jgi:hypothetical protein
VVLANAVRSRRVTAAIRDAEGRLRTLGEKELGAAIDLENGEILIEQDAPADAAKPERIYLIFDDAPPELEHEPGIGSEPIPRPDIAEPQWPRNELYEARSPARHREIQQEYFERLRQYEAAIADWQARENQRKAAWDEHCANWDSQRARVAAAPASSPRSYPPNCRGAAGTPLYVVAAEVMRIDQPPNSAPSIAPVLAAAEAASPAGRQRGHPREYDVDGLKQQMRRRVVRYGLPASQAILVAECHAYLCHTLRDPPAERSVRRWVVETWQELEDLFGPCELKTRSNSGHI